MSGLDSTIDVIEHREGGENITTRKLPGQVKFSQHHPQVGPDRRHRALRLAQAMGRRRPAAARKNGSIVLLDRQGQEKARWNFFNAWPSKWTGPTFNAEGNDVAIETLELAHEGLARA